MRIKYSILFQELFLITHNIDFFLHETYFYSIKLVNFVNKRIRNIIQLYQMFDICCKHFGYKNVQFRVAMIQMRFYGGYDNVTVRDLSYASMLIENRIECCSQSRLLC